MCTINKECRNMVNSALRLDTCEAKGFSSAPVAPPAANEPVKDKHPPQRLTEATSLAPIYVPPCRDESRRGDLKEQTPRAARAVLTTLFALDLLYLPPAYMADVSLTQSRWTSREPPAYSRKVSGTADATGPGESGFHPGPDHESPMRLETGWDQSPRERDPRLFSPSWV